MVVPWLTHRFDKREILIGSTLSMLVVTSWAVILRLAETSWFPGNESDWIFVIVLTNTALYAFSLPIFLSAGDSMMADIADEIDLEIGHRREGVLFSARAFTSKATGSLGLLVGGVLLDVIRFPGNATVGSVADETVWQLGFIAGPATSFLLLVSLGFLFRYPLTRARYRTIRNALRDRDAG
ncbi:MAG: MFS transporter [Gammaproteobacteria bacterium]|nr:MFS transporter [Gammaproteobacteria bacterium]